MPSSRRRLPSDSCIVAASPRQVSTVVDGEAVILSFADDACYGLNPVGSRVWELIQEPVSLGGIVETLVSEYRVSAPEAERHVRGFVSELLERGLARVRDGAGAGDG